MRTRYPVLVLGLIVGLTPSEAAQGPKQGDPKSLVRGRAFAEAGRIDLFVASSAAWGLPADDDRNWDPALKLALELAGDGHLKEWPPNDIPKAFLSIADYRAARGMRKPVFKKQDQPYQPPDKLPDGAKAYYFSEAILAPGVSLPWGTHGNVILSRGDVRVQTVLGQSVVFATGDITVGHHISLAIVVCDGDVIVESHIGNSLVVARGNIHSKGTTSDSVLVSGGKVKIEKPIRTDPKFHSKIKEDDKYPFGFVRFFELTRVGVTVTVADKEVRITDVADAKTFVLAGAKVGDVIESVNGTKPESAESLRRLLRDGLAVGDAAVRVKRGDTSVTLKVALPD